MSDRPLVVQTEALDPAAAAWLRERCEVVECGWEETARLNDLLARAEGLVIRTYTRVNRELLAHAPRLKVVGRAGVGLDNVDLAACRERGVTVVSTPGANTRAVVELVTAFMLDALRPRVYLERAMEGREWTTVRKNLIAPRQLCDLTLGIIGFGRVGSAVARVGAAMEMRVVYHDLVDIAAAERAGAEPKGMDAVLAEADVLSLHVDGREGNRNLIGAKELARCRRDVVFINTSRGFVVDAAALGSFLRTHLNASAWIDVHEPEPVHADSPLLGLANARLTPHIGAATATAHRNMSWVVQDVWRVLSGERAENPA